MAHMDFTEELARFRTRVGGRTVPALIIPGSLQATTAALLIGALAPQRVAFLLTNDTARTPAEAAKLLGRWAEGWTPEQAGWQIAPGDHTSTLQIYRSLSVLIRAWHDLELRQIAADLTGGTKPMSVGLAKAAYVLGVETLYIESDFAPPDAQGRRQLLPGTQRLVPPPDPYVVFGDIEAAEATRLFGAHDYPSAERIFAALAGRLQGALQAAERTGDAELADVVRPNSSRYAAHALLAAAYSAWDSFDLPGAQARLEAYRAAAAASDARAELLEAQQHDLSTLAAVTGRAAGRGRTALETLADPEAVLPLLGSLWANATRRAAQSRFDSATLLCYRCLELCSQHRLATWGVLSEQPDLGAASARKPDLARRYEAVQRRQFKHRHPYPLPDRSFGLFVGYMLLEALEDPFVAGYQIARVQQGAELRNKSILAHGYRLITRVEYTTFAELTSELLERLFGVFGRDRAAWEARSTFLPLESQ